MNVEDLNRAGIQFSYTPAAMTPEIPYIQDVLFALKLSTTQHFFMDATANYPIYAANVLLVAAAVSGEVYALRGQDPVQQSRNVIAQTIIDLCPVNARCLFNQAYAEARAALGEQRPRANREELLRLCSCSSCRVQMVADNRENACDI